MDQILADETSISVNWALVDNQGSVRDMIDGNGQVLNHLVYDSYGKVTSETNPGFDFRFGYTGRERDQETGLQYNRARYYDPSTGGFIGQDPIGFAAGDANLYRYVLNNPIIYIDPSGLEAVAFFNIKRGELTVSDINRSKRVTLTGVFSGLNKFGINGVNNPNLESVPGFGPIPRGSYDILQSPEEGDWYRLDRQDNSPRDDSAGYRGSFRLHPGTYSEECITVPENKYFLIDSILKKTQTTTVQDRRKGKNAAIRDLINMIDGRSPDPVPTIKRFGTLIVY